MNAVRVTPRDLAALRLAQAEGGVLRRGDGRVLSVTVARLVALGCVSAVDAAATGDAIERYLLSPDGEDYLAALDGIGPLHWHLRIDGVPACRSPARAAVLIGCMSHQRSDLRRWTAAVRARFPTAKVEIVAGTCADADDEIKEAQ
jgi:hypothetical protein